MALSVLLLRLGLSLEYRCLSDGGGTLAAATLMEVVEGALAAVMTGVAVLGRFCTNLDLGAAGLTPPTAGGDDEDSFLTGVEAAALDDEAGATLLGSVLDVRLRTVDVMAVLTLSGLLKVAWAKRLGTPPSAGGLGFQTFFGFVGDVALLEPGLGVTMMILEYCCFCRR